MPTALRAERERLEHVGAAAKAAVDEHRNAVADLGDDFGQRFDASTAAVSVARPP